MSFVNFLYITWVLKVANMIRAFVLWRYIALTLKSSSQKLKPLIIQCCIFVAKMLTSNILSICEEYVAESFDFLLNILSYITSYAKKNVIIFTFLLAAKLLECLIEQSPFAVISAGITDLTFILNHTSS